MEGGCKINTLEEEIMSLNGKVAVVTGAGSGIGKEVAMDLASKGANIVIAEINEKSGRVVADEISKKGGKAVFIKTDVSSSKDVQNVINKTVEKFETIHIMVANAGTHTGVVPLKDMPEDQWDKLIGIHLKGTFLCCKYVLPVMIENKFGKIITVSSVAMRLRMGGINYVVAKGGIEALTKALAVEVGPYNINVNCVAPGFIVTPIWNEMGGIDGDLSKSLQPLIPLGRKGYPKDISGVVSFLASDDGSYISGEVINVNGALA